MLHEHASTVFEDYCGDKHPGAARYWEKDLEFDFVRAESLAKGQEMAVSEVKWKILSTGDRKRLEEKLVDSWQRSNLRNRFHHVAFEVIDATSLK